MLHGKQIEVHFRRIRLILAHSIQKNGDPGRESYHRSRTEAATAQVGLERASEIIVQRDTRLRGEGVGQEPRLPGVDGLAGDRGDPRRDA